MNVGIFPVIISVVTVIAAEVISVLVKQKEKPRLSLIHTAIIKQPEESARVDKDEHSSIGWLVLSLVSHIVWLLIKLDIYPRIDFKFKNPDDDL